MQTCQIILPALLTLIGVAVYGAKTSALVDEIPDGYGYWLIATATILQIIIASTMLVCRMPMVHYTSSKHCTGQTNAAFTDEESATQSTMQHLQHSYNTQAIGLPTMADGRTVIQGAEMAQSVHQNVQNLEAECSVHSDIQVCGAQRQIPSQACHCMAHQNLGPNSIPSNPPSVPQPRYATHLINPVTGRPMQSLPRPRSVASSSDINLHHHPEAHSLQPGRTPAHSGMDSSMHVPVHHPIHHQHHNGNPSSTQQEYENPGEIPVDQHDHSQLQLSMSDGHELTQEADDGKSAEQMDVPPSYNDIY